MKEKVYRLHFSEGLDKTILSFLDSVKPTRRAELSRYMMRYYMSQLKEDQPSLLPLEHEVSISSNSHAATKEFKLRLDITMDADIIAFMEQIPRKRRSEFVRYIFHYYVSHLQGEEYILIPTMHVKKVDTVSIKETKPKEVFEKEPLGDIDMLAL